MGMEATANGWKIFDADAPILTYEYSFGPGMANALAVGAEDGLVVVSPPRRVNTGVFEDLSRYGRVGALVASNAFHHMGIPEWKRRFPDAAIYAPAQAIARVERKTKLTGIRPLAETSSVTGSRLELIDMPHYKTGEVLVRIKTGRGLVWYITDFAMNMPELPAHPVARLLFKLSGSAPGLKFNNIGSLFMVRDKAGLKRWLASEFDKAPPRWLIMTHGDIVEVGPNLEAVRKLFAAH
jgi:hypothetical protein